jgi:murein DD-endopeptidase MepM/ murein hydrolase activator NlpD/uncharacterized protein YraI
MAFINTNFSQYQHGFHFVNSFEIGIPVKFQIPFAGAVDLSKVVFGLCGGMCFTALDYFKLGQIPPQDKVVKEIDRKLFIYLCERQLDSLKIPTLLKVFEWMLIEDQTVASRLSRIEIPKLRRMLDKGEPAVLALIRVKGLDDPTQNHQVLATGYEFDPAAKKYKIMLYDPNHPGEEPHLSVTLSSSKSALEISQSTGEPLRGFFIIPYSARKTPPRFTPQMRSFSLSGLEDSLPFHLCWPVDSRRVNQYFGDNPDTYKPFGLPGHEGLDLYAPSGANIYAAASGEVYETGHPQGHPYGLQIRIKHSTGDLTYQTIYAHLSKSVVNKGQQVAAGELIGLADNTGNSFGSHLHLTLKIEGKKTSSYPSGIVDPWPYLRDAVPQPDQTLPDASGLTVYTSMAMNLRSAASTESSVIALLPAGEPLSVLGEASALSSKIGKQGEWLQVKTSAGAAGFVAAWLVQDIMQAFPPSDLVVYPFNTVNLRSGPGTAFNLLATLAMDDPLTVLGDADIAKAKLGEQGEWLQIQTEDGKRGFVAAWLVHRTGKTAPSTGLIVYPIDTLNVRARPSTNANILTVAAVNDPLTVLGDPAQANSQIGVQDQWLNIQTPDKFSGYVAAWLVRTSPSVLPPASPAAAELTVYPRDAINVRAQPSTNAPRVGGALRGEPLLVVESDLAAAGSKIGKADLWVHIQKKDGKRGWAAAWLLDTKPA